MVAKEPESLSHPVFAAVTNQMWASSAKVDTHIWAEMAFYGQAL